MTYIDGFEVLDGPVTWNRGDLRAASRAFRAASRAFNSLPYGDERRMSKLPSVLDEVFRLLSEADSRGGCGTCRHRRMRMMWNSSQFPGLALLSVTCGHSDAYVDAHGFAVMQCANFTPEADDDPEPHLL